MNIVENEMSLKALRYKQICDFDDVKSRVEKNNIVRFIRDKYIGVLRNKQRGIQVCDHNIIESWYNESIMYALTKWKGQTQFGVYLTLCFKSIIGHYLQELSPVNRKDVKGKVSFEAIIENLNAYEDGLDYDSAGLFTEDDELKFTKEFLNQEDMDYSEVDDQFERWKFD